MQAHSELTRIVVIEQERFEPLPSQASTPRKGSTFLCEEPAPAEILNTYLHHLCHYKRKPHHWLTPELSKLVAGKR